MLSGGTEALTGNDLNTFLQGVRDLIVIGLTSEDLSADILTSQVYFQSAEFDLIRQLSLTMDQYDTKLSDPNFKKRAEISTAYRMAAKVLPALPQIIEQRILTDMIRYYETDLNERISLLLSSADDAELKIYQVLVESYLQ